MSATQYSYNRETSDYNHLLYNKVSIKPNSICFFYQNPIKIASYQVKQTSLDNLRDNDHKGDLSIKASKKINIAIDWLMELAKEQTFKTFKNSRKYKFKINFITLTLPSKQEHSDTDIKNKCLNQFLIEAKKHWNLTNYIWKAEAQANGNIHFHITCDKFIPHTQLRDVWNRIINKLDYVEAYRTAQKEYHKNGFQVRKELLKHWSIDAQRKAYKRGFACDWCSPNSTDVHAVKNINNLAVYLKKYFSKNDDKRAIEGRLWGVSRVLGAMRSVVFDSVNIKPWHMKEFCDKVYNKARSFDFFRIHYVRWDEIKGYFEEVCEYLYNEYLKYFRLGMPPPDDMPATAKTIQAVQIQTASISAQQPNWAKARQLSCFHPAL